MKKILKYCILLVLCLNMVGCDEGFENYNVDPTQANNLDPNIQLAQIELEAAGNSGVVEITDLYLLRPFVQYMNGAWATHFGSRYIKRNDWSDSYWGFYYTHTIKNLVDLVERTKEVPEYNNMNSIGRILKVFIFSKMTDLYGDIPYFEAGMAFNEGILNPAYDRQEDIYNDFFKELDEAVKAFDTESKDVTGDFYYEGDIEKWKRFANSLRLRLAMRLSEVNPEKAEFETKAAFEGGVMTSNEDICLINYGDFPLNDARVNPIANALQQYIRSAGNKITGTLVDYMQASSDPRLTLYARAYDWSDVTDVTRFCGINGLPVGAFWWDYGDATVYTDEETGETMELGGSTDRASISKFINAKDAPMILFTYAETEFLVAEAAVRGWLNVDVSEHYENALRAGVKQMELFPEINNVSDADINAFVSINPLQAGSEIEKINSEKWVLLFLDVNEAFSNWRRSGFPKLVPTNFPESNNPGVIPRRFEYPQNEYLNNSENVFDAVSRLGGSDSWTERVWWDK